MGTRGIRQAVYTPHATTQRVFTDELAALLRHLDVRDCFGVAGPTCGAIVEALARARLNVFGCQDEGGAMSAAIEAALATERPGMVFTTTGPGLTGVVTGVHAARHEGAQLVVVSGATPLAERGLYAAAETHPLTLGEHFFSPGPLFDFAALVERPTMFGAVTQRLTAGLVRPYPFVAHLSLPAEVQAAPSAAPLPLPGRPGVQFSCSRASMAECVRILTGEHSVVLWVGFGARGAAAEVRELAHRTHTPVMCSPRGRGTFPEDPPQFLGVTGPGTHAEVVRSLERHRPEYVLVLGSRLGEPTSGWLPAYVPSRAFIHVDVDPGVFGRAYPWADTFGIPCEIGVFLRALIDQLPERPLKRPAQRQSTDRPGLLGARSQPTPSRRGVRPEVLAEHLQRLIVEPGAGSIMADPGDAQRWCCQWLRILEPGRFRATAGFAAPGHMGAGVAGVAAATGQKAFAVVSDLGPELGSAVDWGVPAVWIVLNHTAATHLAAEDQQDGPRGIDFAALARAVGASALRVQTESDLRDAIRTALDARGPFVLDVAIAPARAAGLCLPQQAGPLSRTPPPALPNGSRLFVPSEGCQHGPTTTSTARLPGHVNGWCADLVNWQTAPPAQEAQRG